MAASNFYEVRCENCRTTFPPETKRCIHCGGLIGGPLLLGASAEADADSPMPRRGSNLLWLVTALVAVGMSLLRNCSQG